MKDNTVLMRAFSFQNPLKTNWQQWWVDALLFDALIGNTDRHQDNWGVTVQRPCKNGVHPAAVGIQFTHITRKAKRCT
jgi:hypothetical protein